MTWSSQGGFLEERPRERKERRGPLGRDAGSSQVMGEYVEELTGGNREKPRKGGNPGLEGHYPSIDVPHAGQTDQETLASKLALTLKPPLPPASPSRPFPSPTQSTSSPSI